MCVLSSIGSSERQNRGMRHDDSDTELIRFLFLHEAKLTLLPWSTEHPLIRKEQKSLLASLKHGVIFARRRGDADEWEDMRLCFSIIYVRVEVNTTITRQEDRYRFDKVRITPIRLIW